MFYPYNGNEQTEQCDSCGQNGKGKTKGSLNRKWAPPRLNDQGKMAVSDRVKKIFVKKCKIRKD